MSKLFAKLLSWLSGTSRLEPADVRVLVYTRQGCHLCDEAWDYLRAERDRLGLTLESADVDADPALAARYGDSVPVVMVNGHERFRGRINQVLWRRLVRAELKKAKRNR
jgi:hypothetical protein